MVALLRGQMIGNDLLLNASTRRWFPQIGKFYSRHVNFKRSLRRLWTTFHCLCPRRLTLVPKRSFGLNRSGQSSKVSTTQFATHGGARQPCRATSRALQSWSQRRVRNVRQQILMAKELLWRLDLAEEKRILWPLEQWLRNQLKKKLLGLCSLECTMACQQSRLN